MSGYWNRVLEVDLTSQSSAPLEVPPDWSRDFIGGGGMAARFFFEERQWNSDPLGPDNHLYVMAGPLVGTALPGSSRFAVCARSPQTSILGESTCGGDFGPELRRAGWDGIVIKGASQSPVVIVIDDYEVGFASADSLWGLDTYATRDRILSGEFFETWEGRKPKTLVIGQAGENLVRFAAIANTRHDYAARTGMGAVMGSKMLKGVAVRGTQSVPIADPEGYREHRKEVLARLDESVIIESLRQLGTSANIDLGMMMGDIPIDNWTRGDSAEIAEKTGGPALDEHFVTGHSTCYACPTACKLDVGEKAGPEYETAAGFGSLLGNSDPEAIIEANERCNKLGLDTISAAGVIAFAYDLAINDRLPNEYRPERKVGWGDASWALELLDEIGNLEGLGAVLAEGSRGAAEVLGDDCDDFTAEVKGLEIPFHDPRGSHGLALAYAVSNRGGCHKQHVVEGVEHGFAAFEDVGFEADYEGQESEGKAKMVKLAEDFGLPMNAMAFCEFDMWPLTGSHVARMLEVVTGDAWTVPGLCSAGERMWLLKRSINALMGVRSEDDRLPRKVMTALTDGGAAGSVPDLNVMLKEYYQLRGLSSMGIPLRNKLSSVGLGFAADELEDAGLIED